MPRHAYYGQFPDLSIAGSASVLAPSTFGEALGQDTSLRPGANVATVAKVNPTQLVSLQHEGWEADDLDLVTAVVAAMELQATRGTVAHVVTSPRIAHRLARLLRGDVDQFVVPAVVPTSVLHIGKRPFVATDELGLHHLTPLLAPPSVANGRLPAGAWIEVDRLILPAGMRTEVGVWHVQAEWPLPLRRGALQIDGTLVRRGGRVVATAGEYRTVAVGRWLREGGTTTFEVPLDRAQTLLGALMRRSPASVPSSVRARPRRLADGYATLRALLREDVRLLPRVVAMQPANGAVDFWAKVIDALPGLQALLKLPREVLEAGVLHRCAAPTEATRVLLKLMDARVLVAALMLGDDLELSRVDHRDVVRGSGCSAVFDPGGRLVGGTSESPGISSGEWAAWRRVPRSAGKLIDGGAAADPSEAFLLIAGKIDAESMRRPLTRHDIVEHLRFGLRGQEPVQGPRHRVLVMSVADPRRSGRASAGAVALMREIAEAGFVVVSHGRDMPVDATVVLPGA